jgi:hypothetical protein
MADFLEEKEREIAGRLKELEPLVEEYRRLEAAAVALRDAVGSFASEATSAVAATVTGRRRPGRPRGSANRVSKAAPVATAAATPAATPAKATRKKPGRPPGRKKVGRPKTKKAGRPPGRPKAATATTTSAPAAAPTAPAGRRRPGRRKGSGTRAAQALRLVRGQPGITIPELAAKMGIKQNYLYRVLPALEQEGKIAKQGRGWHPKG